MEIKLNNMETTITIAWKVILIVILFITAIIQKRNVKILKAKVAHKNSLIIVLRHRLGDNQDTTMPEYENRPLPPNKTIKKPIYKEPQSDSLYLKVHDQRIIPQCTN